MVEEEHTREHIVLDRLLKILKSINLLKTQEALFCQNLHNYMVSTLNETISKTWVL